MHQFTGPANGTETTEIDQQGGVRETCEVCTGQTGSTNLTPNLEQYSHIEHGEDHEQHLHNRFESVEICLSLMWKIMPSNACLQVLAR